MSKLLIIEDSPFLCRILEDLVHKYTNFDLTIAETYKQTEEILERETFDFTISDLNLPDAKEGRIVALLNRKNIAPIVFTSSVSEELRDSFEEANIVDYVLKERFENIIYVIEKTLQLEANRKKKVLIVDDSLTFRYFLKQNLEIHQFQVIEASNGSIALEKLAEHPEIELVITDYHMPVMDGLELVRKIRKKRTKKDLSIIALSAETNSYVTSKFLKEGSNDYITKPYSRDEFYARVYQNIENIDLFQSVEAGFESNILSLLCNLTERKSAETGSHIDRVSRFTYILARACGIFEEEADMMGRMATLHDIGKIAVPESILTKPGKLTPEEFTEMKKHSLFGKEILEKAFDSSKGIGKVAVEIAYSHHERYDGSGYPQGLKGEEIPLSARIVTVADIFDALTHARVYKKAWSMKKVLKFFNEESGKIFEPKLVELLMKNLDKFEEVLKEYD